ncbi:THAP domain-containing protein 7 [Pempheris klunzingeri]|uniref:THAP domain-containing protein 7 n=1 Tax=Pempheris klunzingeri TaxID=3127111 RepID=UPI00397F51F3
MPRHCSAGGCKTRDNRETRNVGITFHKLPKGATQRNLWISNSHRADSWDPQTDFVYFCSKHFTRESFELSGCSGIRRLKKDAFPTIFDSSSTTKYKKSGALQKQEGIPHEDVSPAHLWTNPHSDDKENTQQEKDKSPTSEEATVQRSVAAAEEPNESIPASSQEEPSRMEQLSQQEHSPSPPPPVPRPLSPSCYMRRLPPPPGFYLSKEHSYAQLCPLLWRRRYDQAIDCLEKALRQLHAARRRENRLRSTVLRLRDKRLKQALLVSQNSFKNRGGLTPGGGGRQGKGGCNQVESEADAKPEDPEVFEDRCVDQKEFEEHLFSHTSSWSEQKGHCFFCGKGQAQVGQVAHRVSKTGKYIHPIVHDDSPKLQRNVESSSCSTAEAKDTQVVGLERPPVKSVETIDTEITNCQVLLQTQGVEHVIPVGVSLSDIHEQSLHFLGSQQQLLLSDMCEGETMTMGEEHHQDLQQQQFWIQNGADGQVILVPASPADVLQSIHKLEGVTDEAQTILVSEVALKRDLGHVTEYNKSPSRAETACDGKHGEQHSVVNTTLVEMREDVREKLKEHLEGFHLQLSTDFLN